MPENDQPELTAQDRCDRCGARAVHRTLIPGAGELLWCNHDYQEHREALDEFLAGLEPVGPAS